MTFIKVMKAATLFVVLGVQQLAFAGVDTETDDNDVILAGHDAVAYFTQNKAVKGNQEFTATHQGAIYHFSSAKNRDEFKSNPNKYEPAYGGFCAYGTTFGKKFDIDGKAFEIVDGKLYVNKNLEVYQAWKKDIPKHVLEANGAWGAIKFVAQEEL